MASIIAALAHLSISALFHMLNSAANNSAVTDNKRAKITDEHRQEAALLMALWEARDPKMTQAEFGEVFDLGNQANVGHYLHARSALNPKAALAFARGLRCQVKDFSPRIARTLTELSAAIPTDSLGGFDSKPVSPPTSLRPRLSSRDLVLQLRAAMLPVGKHERLAVVSHLSAMVENIDDEVKAAHFADLIGMTLSPPPALPGAEDGRANAA